MIAGLLFFGFSALQSGDGSGVASLTIASAVSSVFGYFGFTDVPALKLLRTNLISIICTIMCIVCISKTEITVPILALMVLHMLDSM